MKKMRFSDAVEKAKKAVKKAAEKAEKAAEKVKKAEERAMKKKTTTMSRVTMITAPTMKKATTIKKLMIAKKSIEAGTAARRQKRLENALSLKSRKFIEEDDNIKRREGGESSVLRCNLINIMALLLMLRSPYAKYLGHLLSFYGN
ncbi:hypothetical protein BDZ89DRAFT_1043326 [Hymenopellis radicata]|nr:hypothetical protein BDZ89DRAFT_1043326 [Hymenopellis radicata]